MVEELPTTWMIMLLRFSLVFEFHKSCHHFRQLLHSMYLISRPSLKDCLVPPVFFLTRSRLPLQDQNLSCWFMYKICDTTSFLCMEAVMSCHCCFYGVAYACICTILILSVMVSQLMKSKSEVFMYLTEKVILTNSISVYQGYGCICLHVDKPHPPVSLGSRLTRY
uniref:Uncharacterized protein n=1 Tax=Opuntia streptacantha TaxID=393608 RepID=A0A7C9AEP0_OPUST